MTSAVTRSHAAGRPDYLRPGPLALVVAGGAGGTAVRAWAEAAYPPAAGEFPWATFVVNVSGAFLLGLLLELLAVIGRRGFDVKSFRLALGTGLLGGYTTYSTFVIETLQLGSGGQLLTAVLYDVATLTTGFVAALLAMAAVRRLLVQSGRDRSAGSHG